MKLETDKKPHSPRSPEIVESVREFRARYGKHALPDGEARGLVDKAMGKRTLSEELRVIREG